MGTKVTKEIRQQEYEKLRKQIKEAKALKEEANAEDKENVAYRRHRIVPRVAVYQPEWTMEEIKEAQRLDLDLSLLYKHKSENLVKPTLAQISGVSAAATGRSWK